jgi:hypothetical protein
VKLRILVDSTRSPPTFGELSLVVAEGGQTQDGKATVHFVRSQLQVFKEPESRLLSASGKEDKGKWVEVPMEFISHAIGLNVNE